MKRSFQESVFEVVRGIPKGSVLTYKQVAEAAGFPGASRAVGTVLSRNTNPQDVPCHRVVRSDGVVGEYRWGQKKKQFLLRSEGVRIVSGRIVKSC